MKRINKQQITEVLLWLAFGALLATSIPHVAWWFNSYEPHDNWLVGYAMAISIDVVIGWLAYLGREDHKIRTYSFVLGLVVLSWIGNYLFDVTNAPAQAGVWSWGIYHGVTIGQVSPFIVSSVPLLILAYTNMLSSVRENVTPVPQNVIQAVLNGHTDMGVPRDVLNVSLDVLPVTHDVPTSVTPSDTVTKDVRIDLFPFEQAVTLTDTVSQEADTDTDMSLSNVTANGHVPTPVTDVIPTADTMSQAVPTAVTVGHETVFSRTPVNTSGQGTSPVTVSQLMSQGRTLQEIADMRGVTVRTVRRHRDKEALTL